MIEFSRLFFNIIYIFINLGYFISKILNGIKLDKLVIDELKKLSLEGSNLSSALSKDKVSISSTKSSLSSEIDQLKASIENNDKAISNLVNSLSEGEESNAAKYLINKIDNLDEENSKMKERLLELEEKADINKVKVNNIDIVNDIMTRFNDMIDSADVIGKRNLIRSVVDKITWDGENIDIVMFGADSKKK